MGKRYRFVGGAYTRIDTIHRISAIHCELNPLAWLRMTQRIVQSHNADTPRFQAK